MPPNRNRAWADTRLNVAAFVAGVQQEFNLLLAAPTVDTLTVVRIVADFWIFYSPNATIVDSLSIVDVGVGVTSSEAFAARGTSLPQPGNSTEYPPRGWLYVSSQLSGKRPRPRGSWSIRATGSLISGRCGR